MFEEWTTDSHNFIAKIIQVSNILVIVVHFNLIFMRTKQEMHLQLISWHEIQTYSIYIFFALIIFLPLELIKRSH